jgi:high-affinity nickel permease
MSRRSCLIPNFEVPITAHRVGTRFPSRFSIHHGDVTVVLEIWCTVHQVHIRNCHPQLHQIKCAVSTHINNSLAVI